MTVWPRSLFGRTAVLIAGTLILFSIIAWQAVVWSLVDPAANMTAQLLTQNARAAIMGRHSGLPLPEGTRFEAAAPITSTRRFRFSAYGFYIETIESQLSLALGTSQVYWGRSLAPLEIWIKTQDFPDAWLVLSWRLARPRAPLFALGALGAASLLVLGAAAFSTRRLTAPLAGLAAAAAQVAEGDKIEIRMASGPSEVRSLAVAFQSMAHRLAELDEQRELMLGGISHDLRTPLARIRVAIELLNPQDEALIEELASSVEEIDRMVGQFLYYVRANYREPPVLAALDEIVRQTLSSYAADVRLRLILHSGEPSRFPVECVRHAVLNLVQNALDHGRPPVTVRTYSTAQDLAVIVEDHGEGIDSTQWLEALRPFSRLQSLPSHGHTGLGLALVDRLLRTSGGSLAGQQMSNGFRVIIRLPVVA